MYQSSSSPEKQSPPEKQGSVSFLETLEANERYFKLQKKLGNISNWRFEEFKKSMDEMRSKYESDKNGITQKFNQERSKILRDTGIELSEEKNIAELQRKIYSLCGVDQYTYKNSIIGQFQKGIIDGLVIEGAEMIVLLSEHGTEVLKSLLSWNTLKHLVTSIGEPFYGVLTGDSYIKGKNIIGAVLSAMGAASFINLLTKGVLKTAISNTGKILKNGLATAKSIEKGVIEFSASGGELVIQNISSVPKQLVEWEVLKIINQSGGINKLKSIRLPEWTSSEVKRHFYEILAKNQPLLALERVIPGSKLVHVKLGGVKAINDFWGQALWDSLGKSANSLFQKNMELRQVSGHARMLWREHSWAEFSLPKESISSQVLFAWKDTRDILTKILQENRDIIGRVAREKHLSVAQVEDHIRKNFRISIGEEIVSIGESSGVSRMEKLLEADYRAEMAAKRSIGKEPIRLTDEIIASSWKEIVEHEKTMLAKYFDKTFQTEGIQYPIVAEIEWQIIIHPKLQALVRKGEFPAGEIANDTREYLRKLNDFDYIVPTHDLARDISVAQEIAEDFTKGKIQTKHLSRNFKGTLTNEALYAFSEWKKGMAIFIDIRDMGIQNLALYRKLGHKVASGEYVMQDLLHAGKGVTDKFIGFVDNLNTHLSAKFPGANIALGGDEVRLFIPWASKTEKNAILESIKSSLSSKGLEWRIAHSFETSNIRGIFDRLDRQTALNKTIEKVLDTESHQFKMPGSVTATHLEISPKIPSETLKRVLQSENMRESIRSLFSGKAPGNIQLESWIVGKIRANQWFYSFEFNI